MIGRHICKMCKNFTVNNDNAFKRKCKAFPNGIPERIYAYMDQWKPHKNCNNGIGFEPKEDEDE